MKNRNQTVCVIGLGYVGLPLAVQCALNGYRVFGLENDKEKNILINNGKSPIKEEFLETNLPNVKIKATHDPKVIRKSDVILVCADSRR